ncbi:unannotated protein [freshwater metagenome]|uniref:Unannotated protein n=1 Tax=freshwater metagenome TaxID=449393 RepID=A0A6J6SWX4_9ZZZZ|nr:hypothetical protein [Actinomycetota bacterium]
MIEHPSLVETRARAGREDRLSRSSTPRPPRVPQRHRLAGQLRRVADRLDG